MAEQGGSQACLLTSFDTILQGSLLDGHALVLQLSHKKAGVKEGADKKEPKKPKASSTKIIVRNVVSIRS